MAIVTLQDTPGRSLTVCHPGPSCTHLGLLGQDHWGAGAFHPLLSPHTSAILSRLFSLQFITLLWAFFSFPSPGLNHSTSLEGKPRRAGPALEGNLEAIYHFRFPLVKSFLSVTKMQLMVPCYPVHSLALFSAALGKKLSQLPMLINHANYGRWKLSNSGLLWHRLSASPKPTPGPALFWLSLS